MILDSITLSDFGLYAGHQTIPLTPPSRDKPIILFGGLNGGGKTTVMDAIQLCLFGAHAKTSSRGRTAYSEYLSRCIHDSAADHAAGVQLCFRRTTQGETNRYTLKRTWRLARSQCKEEFNVLKDGRLAHVLAENWANQVEDFIPANIAQLFFFDGEQIERYASATESASLIETAIRSLLGLDLVDQLQADVRVFARRKKSEGADQRTQDRLSVAQSELDALRKEAADLKQAQASLRTHRLDRARRTLEATEEEFRRRGGDLFDRRQDIDAELAASAHDLQDASDKLRTLAAGPAPLLLLLNLIRSASQHDRDDQQIARARGLHGLLGDRDQRTLEYVKAIMGDHDAVDKLRGYLADERATHRRRAEQQVTLDLSSEGRGSLTALVHGQLDHTRRAVRDDLAGYREADRSFRRARTLYSNIPQADEVADVIQRRGALEEKVAQLEGEHEGLLRKSEVLQREIERRESALDRLLEAESKERQARLDKERVLKSASRVRETLSTFQEATIRRHISRIEQLVLQSYQQLLRKTSLVSNLKIDPTIFKLTLFGGRGMEIPPQSLSAGERQLLGMSLLWGLAKASDRPLPTAIDTPLGRLDSTHRRHFVERYLPFASHQTLVFSTDEEITGGHLARLEPWIGRRYYLNYDERLGRTTLERGYFDGRAVGP